MGGHAMELASLRLLFFFDILLSCKIPLPLGGSKNIHWHRLACISQMQLLPCPRTCSERGEPSIVGNKRHQSTANLKETL